MYIFNCIKAAVFTVSLALSCNAHAGIIDTTNDSFIDENTGLEWMDFGINNKFTYNYVASQLGTGGVYEGWRLPTESEVLELWVNTFTNLGLLYVLPDGPDNDVWYVEDAMGQEILWPFVDIMGGHNDLYESGTNLLNGGSAGWFQGTNGLANVEFSTHKNGMGYAYYDNFYRYNNAVTEGIEHSTLLVLPAPSALSIFLFGLISLGMRRKYFDSILNKLSTILNL